MTVTKQNVFKKTNLEDSKQREIIPPVKVITILMKLVKKETLALDMCDFLTGHLAGERVYPGDKGKYYLPITEKTKSLIPDHYLYGEGNGKLLNLHGVRKSGILVVEVILSQGLSLTL